MVVTSPGVLTSTSTSEFVSASGVKSTDPFNLTRVPERDSESEYLESELLNSLASLSSSSKSRESNSILEPCRSPSR